MNDRYKPRFCKGSDGFPPPPHPSSPVSLGAPALCPFQRGLVCLYSLPGNKKADYLTGPDYVPYWLERGQTPTPLVAAGVNAAHTRWNVSLFFCSVQEFIKTAVLPQTFPST